MLQPAPYPGTSTAPQPGTTEVGGWQNFLNSVLNAAPRIIDSARNGTAPGQQNSGFGGNGPEIAPQPQGGSMLGLIVVAVIFLMVLE